MSAPSLGGCVRSIAISLANLREFCLAPKPVPGTRSVSAQRQIGFLLHVTLSPKRGTCAISSNSRRSVATPAATAGGLTSLDKPHIRMNYLSVLAPTGVLTYKAIRAAIETHEGDDLYALLPLGGSMENPRVVYVSREVAEAIDYEWPDTWEGQRYAAMTALLESFVEGAFFTVARNPFAKERNAMIAPVNPTGEDVWDFRCLHPGAGIRVFGCFSEPNTFVALTFQFREDLHSDDWIDEVRRCKTEWVRLFGCLKPYRGGSADAYVPFNSRAV